MRSDLAENKKNRLNEIKFNTHGTKMQIIEYINANDITIMFENPIYIMKHKKYETFKKGTINSPFDKTIFERGCLGSEKTGIKDWRYIIWHSMMDRCYNPRRLEKHPTYKEATVCEEWLNFMNFRKWFDKNYYEIENQKMELDKDILIKGNKVYSPNTCVFVPNHINTLFIKKDASRGKYPIGVSFHKRLGLFRAYCNDEHNKQIHLGYYTSEIEAFNHYKKYKEELIKKVADKYKNKIPKKLYEAMYKYKVDITD